MTRLARYIIGQILSWQLLALAGVVLAFLVTQLVRVAPVFSGAGVGAGEVARAVGLLLVPVAAWAMTPAYAVAVFAAAGRMAADGELTAIDASGLGRMRVLFGPVLVALASAALTGWLWLDAGPSSQTALRRLALSLAGRAIAGHLEPGVFSGPLEGLVFYADRGDGGGRFDGVFVADTREADRPVHAAARSGRIAVDSGGSALEVSLEDGAAFFPHGGGSGAGAPLALTFDELRLGVPLGGELERRLEFLPALLAVPTAELAGPPPPGADGRRWSYALWRRVAGPLGFMAVALAAVVLAFGVSWRRRGVAVGTAVALFLGYHVLVRLGESLLHTGFLEAPAAAMAPAGLVLVAVGALLAAGRARRGGNTIVRGAQKR